jgi:hypothetical protein
MSVSYSCVESSVDPPRHPHEGKRGSHAIRPGRRDLKEASQASATEGPGLNDDDIAGRPPPYLKMIF